MRILYMIHMMCQAIKVPEGKPFQYGNQNTHNLNLVVGEIGAGMSATMVNLQATVAPASKS